MYQPYTYLIGWSKLDKWYYGCQYGKNANPCKLWKTYFTSSPIVKKFRKENGEPDIIQVRHIFKTKGQTLKCEEKILHKVDAIKSNRWLNGNIAGKNFSNCKPWNLGIPPTEETKKLISLKIKEAYKDPNIKEKYKKATLKRKGIPPSEESLRKNREWQLKNNKFKGKHHTEETKKFLSEKAKEQWVKNPLLREIISKTNTGKMRSKEQKEKHSQLMSGIGNPMFGKIHSEETKKLISLRVKEAKLKK